MTAIYLFFQLHGSEIVQALSAIISGASVLANFTKTDKDNRAVGLISRAINFLAANFFALKPSATPPTYNR
jgi:hypothetical protein